VQSESVLHDGAQTFAAGMLVGVDGGSFELVSAGVGVGSVALVSSAGGSALAAQATENRPKPPNKAVTTRADFEKVAYFTAGTLNPVNAKARPDCLTTPFRCLSPSLALRRTLELAGKMHRSLA
jgi:hypothetical protein